MEPIWPSAPVAPEKLAKSAFTSDEAFLRRISLDLIGLPLHDRGGPRFSR